MMTCRSDDMMIREYVDVVQQLCRSLTKRSFGDYQRVKRIERMSEDMMKLADRMVGFEPEDIDDLK